MQMDRNEAIARLRRGSPLPDEVSEIMGSLDLTNLETNKLSLNNLTINGNLNLSDCQISGAVELQKVTVVGKVIATRARIAEGLTIHRLKADSLDLLGAEASNLTINESTIQGLLTLFQCRLSNGFNINACDVKEQLNLFEATVGRSAKCTGSWIRGGLTAVNAQFGDSLSLVGTQIKGSLTLWMATIGEELNLNGCTVEESLNLCTMSGPKCIQVEYERAQTVHRAVPNVPIVSSGGFSCPVTPNDGTV